MDDIYRVYLALLNHGLASLKNAAMRGDIEYCAAESEHLHNLPSLIGDENIHRHVFYASKERTAYLEWVIRSNRNDIREFVEVYYSPLWSDLNRAVEAEMTRRGL